jgi:hypothetical protein
MTAFDSFRTRQCEKLLADWPRNAPAEAAHWSADYATEILLGGTPASSEREAFEHPEARYLREVIVQKRRQAQLDFVQMGRAFIIMRDTLAADDKFWDVVAKRHPRFDREDVELAMCAALDEEN